MNPDEIVIGISSCLLGQAVRYDAGHKHNRYITGNLGDYFTFRPFCPEVAIGLGIPRPPIRLVQTAGGIRVRGVDDPARDVSDALRAYAQQTLAQLQDISGYLFKKGSPSCGMERVKVYDEQGVTVDKGRGLFANTVIEALPELPVEEEGRLMDPVLRENFIARVFIYHRWQCLLAAGLTPAGLVDFHSRHKYILLAHDEVAYRELGRLVAGAGKADLPSLAQAYVRRLMATLKTPATPERHANVLMHVMGYLKRQLRREDKAELLDLIEAYRQRQVPLIVPVTLMKHFLRRFPDDYINSQYYLNPHPRELMLRNHI